MTASLTTTVNSNVPKLVALDPTKVRTTLADVIDACEDREAQENPDVVLGLADLHLTNEGNLVVPGVRGEHALNSWSRHQLASVVGLRWDRWFEGADGSTRAAEMNNRFSRSSSRVKVRTNRTVNSDVPADGTVNAIVSPSFVALRDSQVAREVAHRLGVVPNDLKVIRFNITDMTTSYLVGVGRPRRVDARVGDVWGGVLVRNSNVGYAALDLSISLTRLVCTNGMTAPFASKIVRRRHIGDPTRFVDALADGLANLDDRINSAGVTLARAADVPVNDVEGEVRRFLSMSKLPSRLVTPVMHAYEAEAHASVFGLVQGVTLASQVLSPEERYDLDSAAGEYVRRASSN